MMGRLQLAVVLLLLLGATGLSWHLAGRQERSSRRWALWTFLLGGLPLVVLLIHDVFGMPRFSEPQRSTCCPDQVWVAVADFGYAAGVDLDLGRCASCASYLMAVFYVESTNYIPISDERAEHLLALQGTPELKKELKRWFD